MSQLNQNEWNWVLLVRGSQHDGDGFAKECKIDSADYWDILSQFYNLQGYWFANMAGCHQLEFILFHGEDIHIHVRNYGIDRTGYTYSDAYAYERKDQP